MGQVRGRYTTQTYINVVIIATYTAVVSLVLSPKKGQSVAMVITLTHPPLQVYVVVNDPTFHQVAYALMVVAITYMGFRNLGYVYVMCVVYNPLIYFLWYDNPLIYSLTWYVCIFI